MPKKRSLPGRGETRSARYNGRKPAAPHSRQQAEPEIRSFFCPETDLRYPAERSNDRIPTPSVQKAAAERFFAMVPADDSRLADAKKLVMLKDECFSRGREIATMLALQTLVTDKTGSCRQAARFSAAFSAGSAALQEKAERKRQREGNSGPWFIPRSPSQSHPQ